MNKLLLFTIMSVGGLSIPAPAVPTPVPVRTISDIRAVPPVGVLPSRVGSLNLSPQCLDALAFLYTYMSVPDAEDYTPEYYAAQTESALRARCEMPWGKQIPEREWRHFVLPVRVNNERLDTFRTAMYEILKRRVAGMTMREAVLETNHWCHEHVTYKPSDARTSSPLASMRTATGRCGEESTFTVAALRKAVLLRCQMRIRQK